MKFNLSLNNQEKTKHQFNMYILNGENDSN